MSTKVAFDHWSTSEPGSDRGLGRYATTLSTALSTDSRFAPVYVRKSANQRSLGAYHLQQQVDRATKNCVLYHATVPEHLPLIKKLPWVCSIQDVIPLDLNDYRRLGVKTRLKYMNSKRADVILANSEYTANRVVQRLEVATKDIVVAPIPIADIFSNPETKFDLVKFGLAGKKYVVGLVDDRAPDPRKRYHWIDQVARVLQASDVHMVVTGKGVNRDNYPDCTVLPSMADSELAGLYRNAVAFFYPSAYEGQGLPPLEAMAAGCPVIAFKNSSVQEMVNVPEFLIDDPIPWEEGNLKSLAPEQTIQECVARINAIADNPGLRDSLSAQAVSRSANFTITSLADKIATAYDRALA
ncbi:Glycosyltransferase involved in cell wall bisynthesis [Rhodococcus rhodochrous J3]|uniref:Glycosyltransferase involved in cell wall bisynthesis n=1 Tax=Rhodococcus rhodochrous J3 TaxID=903528 RepID=A0ABY1MBA0_RHORH|nr:glycosyltransferase [Rhodococcus rhodochrous]SMG36762.1 Glycosyltransferase involved in cell wall bisynthesis [Rhodococcus rhodochrous J3]